MRTPELVRRAAPDRGIRRRGNDGFRWRGLGGFVTPAPYAASVTKDETQGVPSVPSVFLHALRSLREAPRSPVVRLKEIPAPGRLAPFSVALTGELFSPAHPQLEIADGRFVVLHDPAGRADWAGTFRVVSLVRAELDNEIGSDPLLSEVAWTWLTDCLRDNVSGFDALGGTVTRVLNQDFGAVPASQQGQDAVELEIRASWTPSTPDLGEHLLAWIQMLSSTAGIPPLPQGVTNLEHRL